MATSDSSDEDEMMIFRMQHIQKLSAFVVVNTLMNYNEDGEETTMRNTYVDPNEGVTDVLSTLSATPSYFKIITNFTQEEFNELCQLVCPYLDGNARSQGWPM